MSLLNKAKSKAAKGYLSKLGWVHEQKDDVLTWGDLHGTPSYDGNRNRKVLPNMQKSAEAVVHKYGIPESGRAERQLKDEPDSFEKRCVECRIPNGTTLGEEG